MPRILSVVLITCLSGCATTKGPPPVLTARGVSKPPETQAKGSLTQKFYEAATKAADSSASGADPKKDSTAMFDAGATLVYANCSDFFAEAGRTQTRLMVWKDAIGILGTLAAGIIALDGGTSTGDLDRLAIITLSSSTALSGIDIYTRRYLFGAENVDAVRELTLNALSAHAAKVNDDPPRSYEDAARQLLDNQALCFPPRIAMLARDAIKNGNVVAYTDGTGPAPALASENDRIVLEDIGDRLGMAGPLSHDQAAAYYWLVVVGATPTQQHDTIQPMLSDIPATDNPFEKNGTDYKPKPAVPEKDFIRGRLSRLSAKSINDLKAEIEKRIPAAAGTPSPDEKKSSRVKVDIM
jgi:hypothetical protein